MGCIHGQILLALPGLKRFYTTPCVRALTYKDRKGRGTLKLARVVRVFMGMASRTGNFGKTGLSTWKAMMFTRKTLFSTRKPHIHTKIQ